MMDTMIEQINMAPPEYTSFDNIENTVASMTGTLGALTLASADSAAFNSSDSLLNITGLTSNPNLTGMVSSYERVCFFKK